MAELGPQEAWRLTTQDVTEWLLQPVAQPHRCSVVELLPDEAVGVPQYMVSHRCVWGLGLGGRESVSAAECVVEVPVEVEESVLQYMVSHRCLWEGMGCA